ncbi:hypothetical protein GON03_00485 [Nocardioides sp. MAH-18]|uniref:GerMN domain-containing protein n=1 Tax=Nocardioides agri TaxID=2682843 RepID=A0A6L6XKB2_9ACTN|nr:MULTISPECIES: Gmad2 immunoglobulin-like domain-containing protein [unclassified Nocardioides]MBA2956492.1 GerMN domain-containing protein [Nocardioides sp. CGMCC 1.13656]MVQ47639.1 hypothetical protein [Nocardioides sp. MAH-18]
MDLQELIHDAVAGVEPTDRLAAIQARAATPAGAARRWWYAAGGVALATAAAVTVVAVVSDDTPDPGHHHGEHDMTADDPAVGTQLLPIYFVGDAADGSRLYREFDEVPAGDPLEAALARMQRPSTDPDYQVVWPQGTLESARLGDGTIDVELGDVRTGFRAEDLEVQEVVYTLQAVAGERLPVRFLQDGEPVLGPVDAAPELDVLNLVSISDPGEGTAYEGPRASILARGRASSFEATVPWEIRDDRGEVVREGFATAEGWQDHLYPWQTRVDVSDLPAGFYTFVVETADPSGGAEQSLLFTDTRTIIVR